MNINDNYAFKSFWKVERKPIVLNILDLIDCADEEELFFKISQTLYSKNPPIENATLEWTYPDGFLEKWKRLKAIQRSVQLIITNILHNLPDPAGNFVYVYLDKEQIEVFSKTYEDVREHDGTYLIHGKYFEPKLFSIAF